MSQQAAEKEEENEEEEKGEGAAQAEAEAEAEREQRERRERGQRKRTVTTNNSQGYRSGRSKSQSAARGLAQADSGAQFAIGATPLLYSDFEASGACAALQRLWRGLAQAFKVPELPGCTFAPDVLGDEHGATMRVGLCAELCELEETLCTAFNAARRSPDALRTDETPAPSPPPSPSPPLARPARPQATGATGAAAKPAVASCSVAAVRLLAGLCCERYAALLALRTVPTSFRSTSRALDAAQDGDGDDGGGDGGDDDGDSERGAVTQRLFVDSMLASTWVSAHAQHLDDLHATNSVMTRAPSLTSVRCELTERDLSSLYATRTSKRGRQSRECALLLALMVRCTSAGTRGWNTIMASCLKECGGARHLCANALYVSLTGMHSGLHPALRVDWRDRLAMRVQPFSSRISASQIAGIANAQPLILKECVRRFVANSITPAMALTATLRQLDRSSVHLHTEPWRMPATTVLQTAAAFAAAGRDMLSHPTRSTSECLKRAFSALPLDAVGSVPMSGSAACTAKPPARRSASVVAVMAQLWSAPFRRQFLPLWAHAATHQLRLSRVDACQYDAVHASSSALKLVSLLEERELLAAQRAALRTPSSALLTLHQAAEKLGITMRDPPRRMGGTISVAESLRAVQKIDGRDTALLMAFARTAWLCEKLVVYDLGARAARQQAEVLSARMIARGEDDGEEGGEETCIRRALRLPESARCLYVCMSCRRVANAHVATPPRVQGAPFNEIGTASGMQHVDSESGDWSMRCAKRASASSRAAVCFEEDLAARRVESESLRRDALVSLLADPHSGTDTGAAARARRDCNTAMQQRRSCQPCVSQSMLAVPLLGRAVCVSGEMFTICAYCGTIMRFFAESVAGSMPCCMRCDHNLVLRAPLRGGRQAASVSGVGSSGSSGSSDSSGAVCRFCYRVDPQRTGVPWRRVAAPLDVSGANAHLPPPLRCVHFCRQHYRPWMPDAMKVVPTRIVLCHIACGARPMLTLRGVEDMRAAKCATKKAPSRKRKR